MTFSKQRPVKVYQRWRIVFKRTPDRSGASSMSRNKTHKACCHNLVRKEERQGQREKGGKGEKEKWKRERKRERERKEEKEERQILFVWIVRTPVSEDDEERVFVESLIHHSSQLFALIRKLNRLNFVSKSPWSEKQLLGGSANPG